MGGNGQFNRLSALDDVADDEGPWRDRLTEDQDLGLRLIAAGWAGRQELRARVDQQGLPGLRRLFRQRTRWSQGNLQAMGLVGAVWRAPIPWWPALELLAYLLMPFWQTIVGVSLVAAAAPRDRRDRLVLDRRALVAARLLLPARLRRHDARLRRRARRTRARSATLRGIADRAGLRLLLVAPVAGADAVDRAPAHPAARVGQDRARDAARPGVDAPGLMPANSMAA